MNRGSLALVLHTHMPYVEGFGTWPFGEEWLWEAIACCYLPLLDALDAAPGRVTLSVTPVLGDQLEAPGALERCVAFLRAVRPESHRLDVALTRDPGEVAALEHSAAAYVRAAATAGSGPSSRSSRCDAGRTSRRKRRQRSRAPGASSWSASTGVTDRVTRPGAASSASSSGR